jgi:hypothetical protein
VTASEIIEQLKDLSNEDRLSVIESASRMIRRDLPGGAPDPKEEQRQRLKRAAIEAQPMYEPGGELTEWSALDGVEFLDEYCQG